MSATLTLAASVLSGFLCVGCTTPYVAGEEWAPYERVAMALGKMRLDRAPTGMPVSKLALADNFRRIAFGLEPDVLGKEENETAPRSEPGVLRRWERPVRWHITTRGEHARSNMRAVNETAARISQATGHDLQRARRGEPANLAIMFLRPEDYDAAAKALLRSPLGDWLASQVTRFGRAEHTPCIGLFLHAVSPEVGRVHEILFGLAIIRDGLPPRLARACVEEELAQTMGLPNDDKNVRPSIFNDDQEFALLTGHDEALLKILYDPRLKPGMTEEEAMAIVPSIIADLDTGRIDGRRK
ncbi:MAG: DUF2927 domain-containing protein [Pseudomonadota bacterium]